MATILKTRELIAGDYHINKYEESQYGYKIHSTDEHNEIVIFWSSPFLTWYINKYKPSKKFIIHKHESEDGKPGTITVNGYNPIIHLR
jgi:hypothetical protein